MSFSRYAIYYLPEEGMLARRCSAWIGWDVEGGQRQAQPNLAGISQITAAPRKYGFHATLKPPFPLAPRQSLAALIGAVEALAANTKAPGTIPLELATLGRFLALVPTDVTPSLNMLAARCVQELDPFRAKMTAADFARRDHPGLSPTRRALLRRWGYPHVLEAFRFHMTLTGRLPKEEMAGWKAELSAYLEGVPLAVDVTKVAVVGEREDGFFERVAAFALQG